MDEFVNKENIESEKKQKKREKQEWKENPFVKVILYSIFVLLTIGTAIFVGICIYFSGKGVYTYEKNELVYIVQKAVLEENADVIHEALSNYVDMFELEMSGTSIEENSEEISKFLEREFEEKIGDEFYRFSIFFYPDTSQEIELYGEKYSVHRSTGDTIIQDSWNDYSIEWTKEYVHENTFDSYEDAVAYQESYNEEFIYDSGIQLYQEEILKPVDFYDYATHPVVTDGYIFRLTYERRFDTKFFVFGELIDAYQTLPYSGKGHNLKKEIERLSWMYEMKTVMLVVAVICAVALFICLILIMMTVGHTKNTQEIRESSLEKIPLELVFAGIALFLWGVVTTYQEVTDYIHSSNVDNITFFVWFTIYFICLILLCCFCCRTLVLRGKAKRLRKSSLVVKVGERCFGKTGMGRYLSLKLPFIWRTLIIYLVITLLEFVIILFCSAVGELSLYILWKICMTILFVIVVSWLHELKKGGEKLVAGDTKYKVNTNRMRWAFKEHGENLNHLNEGLQVAVEERIKSERMKTELITNVSHDIKTPLTSIINYVDLLQKQNITTEPVASYIEVLVRQSARLKKLIEDLVDASKASSGSVAVEMKVMDANLVLAQATAEYVDKLAENKLRLVVPETSEPTLIRADGRHLWRVIDNLLNNAYKYAMPGTRVYANVETLDDRVQITFKNISKDELNVSSDELMERFVRGDSSRNTEGSGLGLSIAKSLCQLMQADFDIEIDGDLYKAIITFELVPEEESEAETELAGIDSKVAGNSVDA